MAPFSGPSHWSSIIPGAGSLLCMIDTLRTRGNPHLASYLELLAREQSEVHVKVDNCVKARTVLAAETFSKVQVDHAVVDDDEASDDDICSEVSETDNSLYSWVSEDDWQSEWSEYISGDEEEVEGDEDGVNEEDRGEEDKNRLLQDESEDVRNQGQDGRKSQSLVIPPTGRTAKSQSPRTPSPLPVVPSFQSRLDTYARSRFQWTSPTPAELAEAGFLFVGPRDNVQCFSCSLKQSFWSAADDPWVRHAQRSPKCQYVNMIRGAAFLRPYLPDEKSTQVMSKAITDTWSNLRKRAARRSRLC